MPIKGCCEKCVKFTYSKIHDIEGGAYWCENPYCPCHTPDTKCLHGYKNCGGFTCPNCATPDKGYNFSFNTISEIKKEEKQRIRLFLTLLQYEQTLLSVVRLIALVEKEIERYKGFEKYYSFQYLVNENQAKIKALDDITKQLRDE